jgi:phosphoribosylformimino-5-aminoimidazole carboxamide ribotide isomerase
MDVLPAIDLRAGKVVRLAQGDYQRQTTYADNAPAVAARFVAAGARWIHMVDLDAARSGQRTNGAVIAAVCRGVTASIELGGGIRDDRGVDEALALGVARVVIGSAAFKNWTWFERLCGRAEMAGKIVLGLDARAGQLAMHGWTEQAGFSVPEIAGRARNLPLAAIVYTDIHRDGMFTGPNLEATAELIRDSGQPVIASGGVGSLKDICDCQAIGCAGAVVGRAWYEGKIDLAKAIQAVR